MKKARLAGLAGLLLLLAGCAARSAPVNPPAKADWTITVGWNFDFTNFAPCSATVTKGCISGFTWGYMNGTAQVPLKTSPASVCSGATQPESCADSTTGTVGIGAVTFFCEANYVDNAGNAGASQPGTSAAVNVAAGSPSNIVVTLK